MKTKLYNIPNKNLTPTQQILFNRGISLNNISKYLNSTDDDINPPEAFGEKALRNAVTTIIKNISQNKKCLVIVDCDVDGYTSSSILINYLHDLFPSWVENNLKWYMHSGKQHGLNDCIDEVLKYDLILCPDSSSNDYSYHEALVKNGSDVVVLDHHEAEKISDFAIIINNQLSDYSNKDLSGAGVVWQFCRYMDKLLGKNNADQYLDLCALGLIADMMSLTSIETKHLIMKGLKQIQNPFFEAMVEKNSFSIGEEVTPYGIAFYVAPFVNAITRSGTQEEKEIVFKAMLKHTAYIKVPSTKRGHKLGEMETILAQSLRVCTNVKSRQTKAQDAGIDLLEKQIEEYNLLSHKVLLFLLEPGQLDKSIAGLVANKFMAKYQRPCCVLTKVTESCEDVPPWDDYWKDNGGVARVSYQGSARGYTKTGLDDFKKVCEGCSWVDYAQGHANAFGLGVFSHDNEEIAGEGILQFINYTDEALKDISSEPVYWVDYEYNYKDNLDKEKINNSIIDISHLNYLWGQDLDESIISIQNIEVTNDMVQIFEKKDKTIKINLSNGTNLMIFKATDEDCDKLKYQNENGIIINVVGSCNENMWMGNSTPQLFLKEYEIIGLKPKYKKFSFLDF